MKMLVINAVSTLKELILTRSQRLIIIMKYNVYYYCTRKLINCMIILSLPIKVKINYMHAVYLYTSTYPFIANKNHTVQKTA